MSDYADRLVKPSRSDAFTPWALRPVDPSCSCGVTFVAENKRPDEFQILGNSGEGPSVRGWWHPVPLSLPNLSPWLLLLFASLLRPSPPSPPSPASLRSFATPVRGFSRSRILPAVLRSTSVHVVAGFAGDSKGEKGRPAAGGSPPRRLLSGVRQL